VKDDTILLVEDNPITRKLVRFTLETQGLSVIDAADGARAIEAFAQHPIALVLQDLCLPDMSGFELITHLRDLPRGTDVPILAFSGLLSQSDEGRVSSAGFDDVIAKPVEPSRLLQIVRAHLPTLDKTVTDVFGKGRVLVVADDDPVQRKLVGFRMQRVGFKVLFAADGEEALQHARNAHPAAVLSDVLMPRLDGFALCMEMRRDPELASVPVVLATNSYVEPTDRDLARRAGAHDLVVRTPELREVLEAVRVSLLEQVRPAPTPVPTEVEDAHAARIMRQLEKQVALNARVNQRCALLSAGISVLSSISEALASQEDIDEALRHALAACFDAGGISLGALYLREGDSPLRVVSFGFSKPWTDAELLTFFGERPLLAATMTGHSARLINKSSGPEECRLLEAAGTASALVVPLGYKGTSFGALVMMSKNGELDNEDRIRFAEAVATQISQALAVAQSFKRTERSERQASEQSSLLRSMLESIADGVVVADEAGRFIDWNAAAERLVDVERGRTGTPSTRTPSRADEGARPPSYERLPLMRAILGENVRNMELFVRRDESPGGMWLSVNAQPWRNDKGETRGGVAVFRDVTQEKATQSQLMVSDRMASVGMLAAGVAHEINNPLACVLANLELAEQDLQEGFAGSTAKELLAIREMIADAREAADRVRNIVKDLKLFSRHEDSHAASVDVRRVLDSSLRMAWNEIRHRARLEKSFEDVPNVEGTESRLGQVFLNLIVNAAQAIAPGAAATNRIRIGVRTDPSGRVVVEISDTGSGISPETMRHLFTPFYTTKPSGVGTGLGLAICHRIVTGFGGEIQVDTEIGKGTTFRLLLRATSKSDSGILRAMGITRRSGVRGRILVIDDEPLIGAVIRRSLAAEHDVVATTNGADALEKLALGEKFDVILCDLMMPQMTGVELYAELKALGGDWTDRLVFLTGGAFTPATRSFLETVPNETLEKPFDRNQLRAVINGRLR